MSGYRLNQLQVSDRDETTFLIDSPMGPVTVTYGAAETATGRGTRHDRFTCRYRGQDVSSRTLDGDRGLRAQIAAIEAEFQAKKKVQTVRKQAEKDPIPALLTPPRGGSSYDRTVKAARFEPVFVRGVDQRSGGALIVRADGTKETAAAGRVLRDLDDSEQADLIALYRAQIAADAEKDRHEHTSPDRVLRDRGITIDLRVRLDLATFERVATYNGVEYRGEDDEAVVSQVYRDLVADDYPYVVASGLGGRPTPTKDATEVLSYSALYRSMDEYDAEKAAEKAYQRVAECVQAAEADCVFDLSLFAALTEPEAAPDPDAVHIDASLRAPDTDGEGWDA